MFCSAKQETTRRKGYLDIQHGRSVLSLPAHFLRHTILQLLT